MRFSVKELSNGKYLRITCELEPELLDRLMFIPGSFRDSKGNGIILANNEQARQMVVNFLPEIRVHAVLELEVRLLLIKIPFDQDLYAAVQRLPDVRWHDDMRLWSVAANRDNWYRLKKEELLPYCLTLVEGGKRTHRFSVVT